MQAMISDWVAKYTHNNMTPANLANYGIFLLFQCDIRQFSRLAAMCTHEQCKRSDYTCTCRRSTYHARKKLPDPPIINTV